MGSGGRRAQKRLHERAFHSRTLCAVTIPNLISIMRFVLVPLTIWCLASGQWQAAFWVFVFAGISDGVDGFIAKHFNQTSELGAYLDPLADKALLVSIYVTLGILAVLPGWLVILVVFRDVMIIVAVLVSWVMGNPITIAPSYLSKANTAAQIVLAAIVLGVLGFGLIMPQVILVGSVVVAALTVASAANYLTAWLRHMAA